MTNIPPSPDLPDLPSGRPPSQEEKALKVLFDEMRKQKLDLIDSAGKRIIELSTGLLGLCFGVIAFGDKFPPLYLLNNRPAQILSIGALFGLILALLCGVLTVQPQEYDDYPFNLTRMKEQLKSITNRKVFWMKRANWCFFGGAALLAILVIYLIYTI